MLDICYLPETGQALLITNDLQHWLDAEADELDAWLTRLLEAVEQEDTTEVGEAKSALGQSLGPTLNRPDTLSGLTEIAGYRGRKYTYVRSDKLRNHIRRYNLLVDIRNNRRFTDASGRFDANKAQRSLQEDFGQGPRKLGIRFTSTQFERGMTAWADSWNTNQGQHTDWLAHSDHFSATTEAAVMRYLAGASLQGGISKTAIGLQAEAQVQASLAEGKATLNTHLPNKTGYYLRMTLPTKNGGQRTLDFGQVRATLSTELIGFAGAKAALAVNLELSMNGGQALLSGLTDDEVADRQSRDADFKPLDIQFNAFAGASGGCGAKGYLEWDNIEARTDNEPAFRALAEFGGQLEGLTGAGANAAYYIGYENGQFRIRARVGAALGVGLTGELVATVNADTIYDFIQCIYRQLMTFDFGYLGFIQEEAFKVLHQVIFGAIATGDRIADCLNRAEIVILSWWESIRTEASRHESANDLALRVLADDQSLIQYAPPETKATLLRCLCLTSGSSISSSSWSWDGLDEKREEAIVKILRTILHHGEFMEIASRMGPAGPEHPNTTGWSFADGYRLIAAALDGREKSELQEWFNSLPYSSPMTKNTAYLIQEVNSSGYMA